MAVGISLARLRIYADGCFERASEAASRRKIPVTNAAAFSDGSPAVLSYAAEAHTIADHPSFGTIDRFDGMRAWAAFLSFDLRKSTRRAMRVGPRGTYVTMHTYLPTMLEVIKASKGRVVGLRGDGAIAMFGVVPYEGGVSKPEPEQAEKAASVACDCGAALVDGIVKVVNPVLTAGGVEAGLAIGVGIDVGEFVATKIGIEFAHELTAYGDCVNRACHRADHGTNRVVVTNDVRRMFPTSAGGRTRFPDVPGQKDAYFLVYPPDYAAIA